MGEDFYRRSRRNSSPDESYAEKFNRVMLRRGPGKPLGESYRAGQPVKNLPRKGLVITEYTPLKEREKDKKDKGLVKKFGVVSAALIAGGTLFITPNITGNVIWNLTSENTNMVGVVFFILGSLGLLFCLRGK